MSGDQAENAEPDACDWLALLDSLLGAARRRLAGTGASSQADDLACEAMAAALDAACGGVIEVRAYAHGVLRHLCADAVARGDRRRLPRPLGDAAEELPASVPDPGHDAVVAWFRGPFGDSLAKTLTPRQRRAFEVLRCARSMADAEAELGLDPRNLRRVFRAIAKKGRKLREEWTGSEEK